MKIHYLQHVPFEGIGCIAAWARKNASPVTKSQLWLGDTPPPPSDYDFLIVMGGPMSVHDEEAHPWLEPEKAVIRAAIDAGKEVLGVCLGAQLIATVLGASVTPAPNKEIGWFPVESCADGCWLPEEFLAFHWHGETFSIPDGATPIARSEGCENQGFIYADRVIGLQFHLEITPHSARALTDSCADELVEGKYIQEADYILHEKRPFNTTNDLMCKVLDNLTARHQPKPRAKRK